MPRMSHSRQWRLSAVAELLVTASLLLLLLVSSAAASDTDDDEAASYAATDAARGFRTCTLATADTDCPPAHNEFCDAQWLVCRCRGYYEHDAIDDRCKLAIVWPLVWRAMLAAAFAVALMVICGLLARWLNRWWRSRRGQLERVALVLEEPEVVPEKSLYQLKKEQYEYYMRERDRERRENGTFVVAERNPYD